MENQDNASNQEAAVQFMIAEYQSLQERARHYEQLAESKTNVYLGIFIAAFTGLFFLSNISHSFYKDAPFITFTLFLIEIFALAQAHDLERNAAIFYHRSGRIRQWFSDLDPAIVSYLPFPIVDDKPEYYKGASLLYRIESTLTALTIISGTSWIYYYVTWSKPTNLFVWLSLGVVLYVGFSYLRKYIKGRSNEPEK